MSIRVYALAKELNVDNQSVMKLCSGLGIVTKGKSALASISDEDAVKVREHFLKGGGKTAASRTTETSAPLEPPKNIVMGRVPTLPSKPRRQEKADSAKVEETNEISSVSVQEEAVKSASDTSVVENTVQKTASLDSPEEKIAQTVSKDSPAENSPKESSLDETAEKTVKEPTPEETVSEDTAKITAETASDTAEKSSEKQNVLPQESSEPTDAKSETPAPQAASDTASSVSSQGTAANDTSDLTASTESESASAPKPAEKTERDIKSTPETVGKTDGEKPEQGRQRPEHDSNSRRGRDGGRDGNRDGNRDGHGRERRKGNGPLSRKMRRDGTPQEEPIRQQGLSVAEKIAQEAKMSAPVRPVFDNSFPTLQNARTIRHEDKDSNKSSHREERRTTGLRLAPLPAAKMPTPKKPAESAGMKPEVRLTPEEIRAARAGDDSIMRRMEQELEKNRAKETSRDGKNRKDKQNRNEKGTSNAQDRSSDKKRKNQPQEKTGRTSSVQSTAMEDGMSKFGSKKTAGKQRKDGGKRASGEMEAMHNPGRDSRFGAPEKRGKSRRISMDDDDDDNQRVRWKKQKGAAPVNVAAPRKSNYVLQLPLTVRSFAEGVGLTAAKVLGKLMMEFGMPMTITSALDETTAQLLAESFGIPVDIRPEVTLEERLIGSLESEEEDDESQLVMRPPVVTFLGHVDHGKTSLLDKIIKINVVSGEKGGITQHIRAYNVKYQDKSVTFVDTPGHEAFTEMRARGANTTDIAVIVVAADDGVMPQTEEAISHARAAGVPIIVALNKIDLPGVNEMRILQELSANELTPSEWGGDVEVVRCSALTGQGIDDLMETILMVAELQEFRANPERAARGVCIESLIQQGRGVVAKLLVQNGTLHTGDVIVCGSSYGRVKAMVDTLDSHQKYQTAGPAMPVSVLGLDSAPGAGDKFYVLDEIADARRLAEERAEQEHLSQLAGTQKAHVTLEGLFDTLGSKEVKMLNIILRTDVRGSIEAIKKELGKLKHDEVQIALLQASVGGITEGDVQLADASDAIIIGFNVVPDENARILAENKGVQVRRYDIIYQLTADVKAALEGMLTPEEHEKELGRAVVQQTFQINKVGTVAGCRVIAGSILRDCKIRIIRNNRVIGTYSLDTLRREKDDVKEVRDGYECGMRLAGFNDVKEGDVFEAFQIESVARTF